MALGSDDSVNIIVKATAEGSGVKETTNDLNSLSKSATTTEVSLSKLSGAVATGDAIYNAFSRTLNSVKNFVTDSYKAYEEQEVAIARLQAGINNVRSATDKHIGALLEQAKALQQVTRFSDEQYISAQGILSTFQLNQRAIATLTPLLADMSEGIAHISGGMPDLEENAKLVAKAIGGEDTAGLSGALRRNGVMLNAHQTELLKTGDFQQRLSTITQVLNDNFKGMAVAAGDTAAGSMAKLHNTIRDVKESVGQVEVAISSGLIGSLIHLIGANGQAITSFIVAGIAATGAAAGLFLVAKAISALSIQGLIATFTNPLILGLTAVAALAGVVVYKAMGDFQKKMADTQKTSTALADGLGSAIPKGAGAASGAMKDLKDKLADVDDQMNKSNSNFQQRLAEMLNGHETKVKDLRAQLDTENQDFKDIQFKKEITFKDSQKIIVDTHAKKIQDLEDQYQKELKNAKGADAQKLADLEVALADENRAYADQQAQKKQQYDDDVKAAKDAHDKKTSDLQKQIDEETALLNKHAGDIASIRNVTMLDEIDKLKQTHVEELKSFAKQKDDIIKSSKATTAGVADSWNGLANTLSANDGAFSGIGTKLGDSMGNALKDAIKNSLTDVGKGIVHWVDAGLLATGDSLKNAFNTKDTRSLSTIWQQAQDTAVWNHRATGGNVTAGQPYMVGENKDGSMNSTTELFVPNTSGRIIPADQTQQMLGGKGMQITQNNTIYTQFDMDIAARELGWRLANA